MAYAYISGIIKHKERELLNPTDIERMADAQDANAAFKVFNDTDYADNLLDVDVNNFQKALDDDLRQVRELFEKHLDKELIKFLFINHDGHNIKLLFKAKYIDKNLDEYLSKSGLEDPKKIEEYIELISAHKPAESDSLKESDSIRYLSKKINLDRNIKHVIDKTKEFIGNKPFPHRVDYIVDREIFHILCHISKNLKNAYIINLNKLQIDLANLKIFLRSKAFKKNYEFIEKKLINYGGIGIDKLRILYGEEVKNSILYFKKYFNNKELSNALSIFEKENNSLGKLEKALEDTEMEFIKKTKIIAYGPEIPVGYYYAKRGAMKNIRTIMTGKLNNIENEEIKEQLRELY